MVACACPLRFHQRPRPVAPARGHHVGVLVVWVLTLGLEAATGWAGRGIRFSLSLSICQAHSERPSPVVIVEVVPWLIVKPMSMPPEPLPERPSRHAGGATGENGLTVICGLKQARRTSSHCPFVISSAHALHSFGTGSPSRFSVRRMHAFTNASPNGVAVVAELRVERVILAGRVLDKQSPIFAPSQTLDDEPHHPDAMTFRGSTIAARTFFRLSLDAIGGRGRFGHAPLRLRLSRFRLRTARQRQGQSSLLGRQPVEFRLRLRVESESGSGLASSWGLPSLSPPDQKETPTRLERGAASGSIRGPQVSATPGQYAEPESSAVNFKSSSIDVGWFFMRV